jgi:hypothetical protein
LQHVLGRSARTCAVRSRAGAITDQPTTISPDIKVSSLHLEHLVVKLESGDPRLKPWVHTPYGERTHRNKVVWPMGREGTGEECRNRSS